MKYMRVANTYPHRIYVLMGTNADELNSADLETFGMILESGATLTGNIPEDALIRVSHPISIRIVEM